MWELFISVRYLLARQSERFISLTTVISIMGVAVGVAALIVVIGVMSGFDEELQNKIVGMNAHLIVACDTPGISGRFSPAVDARIEAAADFISGQAIISNGKEAAGVLLKGIDPAREGKVTKIGEYLKTGSLPSGEGEVLVGSEFAARYNLGLGSKVSTLSLGSKMPLDLKVCGIFTSGMYEYDMNLALVDIGTARKVLGLGPEISGVALKLKEPLKARLIKKAIQKELGYPYSVRTWMDMNRNLFSALRLEKAVMFVILTLIVLVACFNIASTMIMTVIQKTKDIGILKSIGAPNASITKIFVLEGLFIGAIGAALGGAGGLWLGRLINRYPLVKIFGLEEIYYFDKLPVRIEPLDLFLVLGTAVFISLLASAYPAFKAARLSPVEALRYE